MMVGPRGRFSSSVYQARNFRTKLSVRYRVSAPRPGNGRTSRATRCATVDQSAMVMTTLPFLCPCSTYRWASAIRSSRYRLSITGFSFPASASSLSRLVVKGEISGSEDLVVDGEVDGSIALQGHSLTVLPNGRVRSNIEARNVILHGRADGDIHASERVELLKSASLTGNISTARILIEDGAFFKGTIDMQKPEPAPKIQTKPPATATAAVPVAKEQGSVLERLTARKSRGSWSK